MWEVFKEAPKAIVFLVLGAALGIYMTSYLAANSAREHGFEAEFSDYGLLKRTSKPESLEAKNCRELRLAYDAGRQALVEQMRTFTDRKSSVNQALTIILKDYSAARQYDESKNQARGFDGPTSSATILFEANKLRRDMELISSIEQEVRNNLAVEYNNLVRICIQTDKL